MKLDLTGEDDQFFTMNPSVNQTPGVSSPMSGTMGTAVIISGSNFTGTTSVRFGEISTPFMVNSSGQITTTVPRGPQHSSLM